MNYIYENNVLTILNFDEDIPLEVVMDAKKVVISEGVKCIPAETFKKAKNVVSVILPTSLEVIEQEAFLGCVALENINLENVKEIQTEAFKGDVNLNSVDISNADILSNETFAFCTKFSKVKLCDRLQTIPKGCFCGTHNLVDITLPSQVKYLLDSAFTNSGVQNIDLKNVKSIGRSCFEGCHNLKKVNLKNVQTLMDRAFFGCGLESIIINVDNIPNSCFEDCKNLSNVILFNTKKIDSMAFKNTAIKEINLPNSLEEIGKEVFAGCKNLTQAYLPISQLGAGTFLDCYNLKSVSGSIQIIGDYAFKNCSSLVEVNFDSVQKIGNFAFNGCRTLPQFNFSKVESIGQSAFIECKKLQDKDYLDLANVTSIGEGAFSKCESVKNVTLPKIKNIPSSLFEGCKQIKEIEVMEGTISIGVGTFKECENLKIVKLPDSIRVLGPMTFMACKNLESINLPNGIEVLPVDIFSHCENLRNVKLPQNLRTIESRAFYESGIDKILFPSKLQEIDSMAFMGCKNIKKLELANINKINTTAFEDCRNIEELRIPYSMLINSNEQYTHSLLSENFYSNGKLKNVILFDDKKEFSLTLSDKEKLNNIYCISYKGKNYFCLLTNSRIIIDGEKSKIELPFADIQKLDNADYFFDKNTTFISPVEKYEKIQNFLKYYLFLNENNYSLSKNDIVVALSLNENQYAEYHRHKDYFDKANKRFGADDYNSQSTFFKLCYNLGLFCDDERHRINVLNFINKTLVNDEFINKDNISDKLEGLKVSSEVNLNLLNFFKQNYKSLEKDNNCAILVYAINNYNEISQLLPQLTVDKLIEFVDNNLYKNINKGNEKLARLVHLAGYNQSDFEKLQNIFEESKKQPQNVFDEIDAVNRDIDDAEKTILSKLLDKVDADFTFEWLSKHSEYNLVLGNICKCCARLGALGFGIMQSPALDPRVQNIVIKDKNGDFIAKSTVYVNKKRQYAVFNNFVVKDHYREGDKGEQVYEAFMRGINAFIEEYDKNNPESPLLDVTVGMNANKLADIVKQKLNKSPILYQGAKFQGYAGDSAQEQYVVYQKSNIDNNSEKL